MIDEVFLLDQWNCRADDEPYANAATKEDSIVDFNEYSAELLVATRRDSDDTLNALEASRERLLAAARGGRGAAREGGPRTNDRGTHDCGLDAHARPTQSGRARRGGPRQGSNPPRTAHGTPAGRRGHVCDDGGHLRAAHKESAARGGRPPVHVHAAQGSPPRARPRARPLEPDRPVADLATTRRCADGDGRLGIVAGDATG